MTDNILKNIYQENEVDQRSTTEEFSAVQKEGYSEVSEKIGQLKMMANKR